MSMVPRYAFPPGSQISLSSHELYLKRTTAEGYEVADVDTGQVQVISYKRFARLLKMGGSTLSGLSLPTTAADTRIEDYRHIEQLSDAQQKMAKFHFALCTAMKLLRDLRRKETQTPTYQLSIRKMEIPGNRKFVENVASQIFGEKIYASAGRGGNSRNWTMYRGRTLMDYFNIFDELAPDCDALKALVPLNHLKGNRKPRLCWRLRALMTEAVEKTLDLKKLYISNAHKDLEDAIGRENKVREKNGLAPLIVPAQKTLKEHRDLMLSPTEILIATDGVKVAHNKRGRGSTDYRGLFVGELVEIDECKASLVSSAKAVGHWENLSADDRSALEEMDEEIRKRLFILVAIDVATRMPLAWIISDEPRAEATLALLRMATRDKTREKSRYNCEGEPAPAMGLGNVKNDNGTGLRNAQTKEAILGTGATSTDVRTHASADKPYIERLFGTIESVLLRLIHGYTGRRPGELPGYNAKQNGVLDIDELYGILTRFLIDEYPSMKHTGTGMLGRRPAEVLKELNETRGIFRPLDEDERRVQLGWEQKVTPNDEGVRVFGGVQYSSREFQIARDRYKGKVSVYIDPDNLDFATAIIPGHKTYFRLKLQITAFADMTLPQVLALVAAYRKENPETRRIHEDRIMNTRLKRRDLLDKIGVERKLPRSYSTVAECQKKAASVFAGDVTIVCAQQGGALGMTACPGSLTSRSTDTQAIMIGGANDLIDLQPVAGRAQAGVDLVVSAPDRQDRSPTSRANEDQSDPAKTPLGRPRKKGKLI